MHLTVVLATLLMADPFEAFVRGKPSIPPPLNSASLLGLEYSAVFAALKIDRHKDACLGQGVRTGSLCFLPLERPGQVGYRSPLILFPSLSAAQAALRERWGEPIVFHGAWFWIDAETKFRARLAAFENEPARLTFETYVPIQDLIGTGPKWGFERTPILGSSRATLEKAYGAHCDGELCTIFLTPTELDGHFLVQITLKGDVAKAVALGISFDGEARREQGWKLLEKKWGRRIPPESGRRAWHFENRPDVEVTQYEDELFITQFSR